MEDFQSKCHPLRRHNIHALPPQRRLPITPKIRQDLHVHRPTIEHRICRTALDHPAVDSIDAIAPARYARESGEVQSHGATGLLGPEPLVADDVDGFGYDEVVAVEGGNVLAGCGAETEHWGVGDADAMRVVGVQGEGEVGERGMVGADGGG